MIENMCLIDGKENGCKSILLWSWRWWFIFFNINKNGIGDGSDKHHTQIMMSSRSMMNKCDAANKTFPEEKILMCYFNM